MNGNKTPLPSTESTHTEPTNEQEIAYLALSFAGPVIPREMDKPEADKTRKYPVMPGRTPLDLDEEQNQCPCRRQAKIHATP